jgi:hypothetical protein
METTKVRFTRPLPPDSPYRLLGFDSAAYEVDLRAGQTARIEDDGYLHVYGNSGPPAILVAPENGTHRITARPAVPGGRQAPE